MGSTERGEQTAPRPTIWPTLRVLYSGLAGLSAERTELLRPGRLLIGRTCSTNSCLKLSDDRRVSEVHAEIQVRADTEHTASAVNIVDLGSTNGTFVNGHRRSSHRLHDGDVIRVGDTFLLFRMESADRVDEPSELLLGASSAMRALRNELKRIADSDIPVLLLGESGSGKELCAHVLHQQSRRKGPLVPVNCAAIPAELAESQLFGHERGSFSGASASHEGYFRSADHGTLFLDEVGELSSNLQAKLLRVLEERGVRPVGSSRLVSIDLRIVSATNRDLLHSVSTQQFRGDLLARLRGAIVHVPPLRSRREDILPLLFRWLDAGGSRLTARLIETLLIYHWPYNVRELKQIASYLRLHARDGTVLDLSLIADRLATNAEDGVPSDDGVTSAESPPKEVLLRLMKEHQGVVARVAQAVGRSHRHVRRLLEQHNITRAQFKRPNRED